MTYPGELNYTRSVRLKGATRDGATRVQVRRARMAAGALWRLWQAERTFAKQAAGTAARAKAARKADDAQAHWRTLDARVSRVLPSVSPLPAGTLAAQCLPRDDAHRCDATCAYLLRALEEDALRDAELDAYRWEAGACDVDDEHEFAHLDAGPLTTAQDAHLHRWHDDGGQ